MELFIYDKDLILKGIVDKISSFIWTRRYWKAGDFKLLVPFTELNASLLQKDALLIKRGDDEAGQITYINIRKNVYGMEEIEVQGRFVTAWLDKRIVLTQINANDNSQNLLNRVVTENITNPTNNKRKFPMFELETGQADVGSGLFNYTSEPFTSVLLAAEGLAMGAKIGFKVAADFRAAKYIFKVFKGRELTVDQTDNPPCVFSQDFDNVYEQEYTNSTEHYKNTAYIGGEEREGIERVIVEIGDSAGLDRSEVFISASDIARISEADITIPLATYRQMLIDRGNTEIERFSETLNFSSKINSFSNLRYKVDYDIGDRVTCVNKSWGIKITVRITEIMETFQRTRNDIFITFGESLPTLFDKLN